MKIDHLNHQRIHLSSFDQFFYDIRRINLFLSFGLELFDELICLILAPFVSHRHQHLLHKLAVQLQHIFLFLFVIANNFECLVQLLLNILLSQFLQHD